MNTKHLFLVIIFLGLLTSINAQTFTKVKQDSLLGVWNDINQPDTLRLEALGIIAIEGFRFKNPDSTLYYGQLQYDFARSIKNKKYIILALNIIGDAHLLKGTQIMHLIHSTMHWKYLKRLAIRN